MNQPIAEINFLTEKEAIKKLNISASSIRKYRRLGIITYNKFSGAIRYELSDLQSFIINTKRTNLTKATIEPASTLTQTVTNS